LLFLRKLRILKSKKTHPKTMINRVVVVTQNRVGSILSKMRGSSHFHSKVATCFLRKLKCEAVLLLDKSYRPYDYFLKHKANMVAFFHLFCFLVLQVWWAVKLFLKHKANSARPIYIHTRARAHTHKALVFSSNLR